MATSYRPTIYRIETERLLIRCWEPSDAPLLKEAIDESLDHLRPWLPWAYHEPQTIDEKIELLRGFRSRFDSDIDYVLGIFSRDGIVLGGTGYHNRQGKGEREVGYWVRQSQANRGIITEATAALVKVGFEMMGLTRIEIRCRPDNQASASVPRKLGFSHDATLRNHPNPGPEGGFVDTMVWSLFQTDYPGSPAADLDLKAYDVVGRPVEPISRESSRMESL